jgi:hypothetical protein
MAGKKITELPELGTTPAAGDWLVVVDVSDTSESAEGTTKKVLKSDALISNATSGTYVPTISDITSGSAVTVLGDGFWQNIGGLVNGVVMIRIELASATEVFRFDMPVIPTNNFADGYGVVSSWSTRTPTDEYSEIAIQAESATKTTSVSITAAGTVNIDLVINFTYNADN